MYLDFLVDIPDVSAKITYRRIKDVEYVYYEYAREYDRSTRLTNPKRVTIGKRSRTDPAKMQPNQNFLKYFPDADLPEGMDRTRRSSCLKIGDHIVIRRIMDEYSLPELLSHYFKGKDLGLLLDLTACAAVSGSAAGQAYPAYAYSHPLFTDGMRICPDAEVSGFLDSVTEEQTAGFLDEWNDPRGRRGTAYISFGDRGCPAGNPGAAGSGLPGADRGQAVFHTALAYGADGREPLFYEQYPGSAPVISQLGLLSDKARGLGCSRVGFILDRSRLSREILEYMDKEGYPFLVPAEDGKFVDDTVTEYKGTFEGKCANYIDEYDAYGMTVKKKLPAADGRDRYVHIYYSLREESAGRARLESGLRRMEAYLRRHTREPREFGRDFERYFQLRYSEETGEFLSAEERSGVIEREAGLSGYSCIISSEEMTAALALRLCRNRDAAGGLFPGDGDCPGSPLAAGCGAEDGNIFIGFLAHIVRSRVSACLEEKRRYMEGTPGLMTAPAALEELEKIEMVRQTDNVYRLDHAVTETQKTILGAFGIDAAQVKQIASGISDYLSG